MDIRGWPLDRIMQLPDCCFGRRFGVFLMITAPTADMRWDISEIALPEKCVLWEIMIYAGPVTGNDATIRLALGDQLPTATAMMDALEPLLPGLGLTGPEPRRIEVAAGVGMHLCRLKKQISAMGRRCVLEANQGPAEVKSIQVSMVISSIPTEVPDWLCSENLRSP